VRRKDISGRTYHLDRESGKRVSGDVWKQERSTIAFDRAVWVANREEQRAVERFNAPTEPFPPSVSPVGVPPRGGGGSGGGKEPSWISPSSSSTFDDLFDEYEPFPVQGEEDT